ncbi:hypothetical protein HAV_00372 [Candidatus Hepatincola sp. Av]
MFRILIVFTYCFVILGLSFNLYAKKSKKVKVPENKIYLGVAVETYDNYTTSVELGYEFNNNWAIQMDLPINTNFAFIDAIYRFEDRSGFYLLAGLGVYSKAMLKPGIGYSFQLMENLLLQTEVNSYIKLSDNYHENMSGKIQLLFYF